MASVGTRSFMLNQSFWENKKVLVTGHTGFKGSWLSLCLLELGAQVIGYSLKPSTTPNLFTLLSLENFLTSIIADIRDLKTLSDVCEEYQPNILIHMAAQPLVRYSYKHPLETYQTNVLGTVNLLECFRRSKKGTVCINVTTDKCYENLEQSSGYTEEDRLGGYDPYSSSKACSELIAAAYTKSFSIPISTARAGNVIGGGDWSEDRLIPDFIKSITSKKPFIVRSPHSIRPWQHVLEPLSGYLLLAEKLWNDPKSYSGAWNFGPNNDSFQTVETIVKKLITFLPKEVQWGASCQTALHETSCLKLNSSKANEWLGWRSKMNLDEALEKTARWYQAYLNDENLIQLTKDQISFYFERLTV